VVDEADRVFKALADATRRHLLDRLRERNGQTLGELCDQLDMARQSASQHVAILEAANLISTVWRGRAKLHYLNPVPIYQIQQRWIGKFEQPRLRALSTLKRQAEELTMGERPTFSYVTYIHATPEIVWHALTDADLTADYWGHSNISDWQAGSGWQHQRTDGSGIADVVGRVVAASPPRRLVITFESPGGDPEASAAGPDTEPVRPAAEVTFDIEPYRDIVRLTVTHENLRSRADYEAASAGWPAVFANLKSLLETGSVLPQPPWDMHGELRDAQMAKNDAR
jgi:uncharacterized protein YndB with AHSA1/START domain/DNA-binding transcriptional ArsR family regulator